MNNTTRIPLDNIGVWDEKRNMLMYFIFGRRECDCYCHELEKNDPIVMFAQSSDEWVWPGVIAKGEPVPDPICGCNHAWSFEELKNLAKRKAEYKQM